MNQTEFTTEQNDWNVSYEKREYLNRFLSEVTARTVRLVHENNQNYRPRSECARSIESKIGCSPKRLRDLTNKRAFGDGTRKDLTHPRRTSSGRPILLMSERLWGSCMWPL